MTEFRNSFIYFCLFLFSILYLNFPCSIFLFIFFKTFSTPTNSTFFMSISLSIYFLYSISIYYAFHLKITSLFFRTFQIFNFLYISYFIVTYTGFLSRFFLPFLFCNIFMKKSINKKHRHFAFLLLLWRQK